MRRFAKVLLVLSLVAAGGVRVGAARAATPDEASKVDEARKHFQLGVDAYRDGNFDAALLEFQHAYDIEPNYRLLYNLGQVQVDRHDIVAALKLFRAYLKEGGAEIESGRRVQVENDLRLLSGRVANLRVETNVSGALLSIDGVSVTTLPAAEPILINSGVHQVSLAKPGFKLASQTVTVFGNTPLNLDFQLEHEPSATHVPSAVGSAPAAKTSGMGAPFWVALTSTAVFAGAAATFDVLSLGSNHDLDRELVQFPADPERISSVRSRVKTEALLGDAFTGAALVAGAATIYFAIKGPKAPTADRAASAPRFRAGMSGARLLISGEF